MPPKRSTTTSSVEGKQKGKGSFSLILSNGSSPSLPAAAAAASKENVERHPFTPFLPAGARILLLGTFPPPFIRWSVPFFYPNINNDMWKVMGLLFYDDAEKFVIQRTASEIQQTMDTWKENVHLQNGTSAVSCDPSNSFDDSKLGDTGMDVDTHPQKRKRSTSKEPTVKKRGGATAKKKTFLQADLESFLLEKRIAVCDIATSIRRLEGNASDDQLKIEEPTDILGLLDRIPECSVIASTAGLAHEFVLEAILKHGTRMQAENSNQNTASGIFTKKPSKISSNVGDIERFLLPGGRVIHVIRCPSTSRANPMKLSVKAETYAKAFKLAHIL